MILLMFAIHNLLHNPLLYAYTSKLYAWEYLGNKVTLRILYKICFVCLSGKNKRITTNLASKLKIIFPKHCSLTVEMIRSHWLILYVLVLEPQNEKNVFQVQQKFCLNNFTTQLCHLIALFGGREKIVGMGFKRIVAPGFEHVFRMKYQ